MKNLHALPISLIVDQYLLHKKVCSLLTRKKKYQKSNHQSLLLGLDTPNNHVLVHKLRTANPVFVASETQENAHASDCIVDYCSLPFADASMPCVILQDCTALQTKPHELLREIWRTLDDDGTLLMILPYTPMLLHRLHPLRKESGYRSRKVRELLGQHLFVIKSIEKCFYTPARFRYLPLPSLAAQIQLTHMIDHTAGVIFPTFAGILMILAQKQIIQPLHQKSCHPSRLAISSTKTL